MAVPTKMRRLVTVAARLVLAGVFLTSAVGKATSPSTFIQFVSSIPWLEWINPDILLAGVVLAETSISILLIIPRTRRLGVAGSLGALVLFSSLLIYRWQLDPNQECGCFGQLSSGMTMEMDIIRNLVLVLVCGLIIDESDWVTP
jgi:uncharacterized membrane protein YphA (DoxX/SURF4 family)